MKTSLDGFILGMTLILVIGPQNAHVLRVGLKREHLLPTVLACTCSDIALIVLGVAGLGQLMVALPGLETVMLSLALVFLLYYAQRAGRSAWRGGAVLGARAVGSEPPMPSVWKALGVALSFSWLNPHVWVDTAVLVGGAASAHGSDGKWLFAFGAAVASTLWFFVLGYGAAAMGPRLQRPVFWRLIDASVALGMLYVAAGIMAALLRGSIIHA
jgi:L-lysine exporter family protein LysE/ArgO